MKKILFTFICLSQLIFSQDVLLSESGHDQTSLDIYIENTENVYGTQINIDVSGLVGCENVEFGGVLSGSLIDSKLLVSAKVPSEYMGIIKLDNEDLNYPMKSHMIDDLSTFGV
jgi:hypothetical protein